MYLMLGTGLYLYDPCIFSEISINQPGCEQTSECATTGAVCTMNTCVCPNTLYYNGQQCVESEYSCPHPVLSCSTQLSIKFIALIYVKML